MTITCLLCLFKVKSAYYSDAGFSLVISMLWLAPTYLFLQQFFAIILVVGLQWILFTFYIVSLFSMVNSKFLVSIKLKNTEQLMKMMNEHKSVSKLVLDINNYLKYSCYSYCTIWRPTH